MKKTILAVSAVLIMTACAKDHKCTCTSTSNITGSTANTQETTLIETTKGQAKANCVSGSTTSGTVVVTYDCKLS